MVLIDSFEALEVLALSLFGCMEINLNGKKRRFLLLLLELLLLERVVEEEFKP